VGQEEVAELINCKVSSTPELALLREKINSGSSEIRNWIKGEGRAIAF
jgi:hypothetical protein